VRLYVDLETLELIEGQGFRNPVTSLRFKRGDAAKLEVRFLSNGTTASEIGDPLALELQFGLKPRGRYDVGYLVHEAAWVLPATGATGPVYSCSPSFNTVELDSAMQVGSSTGTELSEIGLMGEITWREGSGQPTSTRTFLVIVENDVNRGTEGVPTDAEPAYPAPQNIASPADLAATMAAHLAAADPHPNYLRHDIQESLSSLHRTRVRAAINAPEAPPSLANPMQNIGGTWYPAVLDFAPSNHDSGAMIDGTPGWRGRIAAVDGQAWLCTKDDMTTTNDGWIMILSQEEPPPPPTVTPVIIDSYETQVSFGIVEAGKNYHVRFDNFDSLPMSSDNFGIAYVNSGSGDFSNVQLVASNFISAGINETADFSAAIVDSPASPSDIYAEFTFTADASFDWAGYSYFGMYGSGWQIGFTVTLTEL
jgi:hypothetical protein